MPSSHRTLHSGNIWSDLFTILLYYRLLRGVSLFRTLHSHNYTPGHPSEAFKINRKVYICKDVSVYQCVMAAWCLSVSVCHGSMMSLCIRVSCFLSPHPDKGGSRSAGKWFLSPLIPFDGFFVKVTDKKYLSFNDFQFPQRRLNFKLKVRIVDWHKSLASSVHQAGFT